MFSAESQGRRGLEWLPTVLAALAFVGCAVVFGLELFAYQHKVVEWAGRDLRSRARLAANSLAEPLRTQDFDALRRFGDSCKAEDLRLRITTGRGGLVFDTQPASKSDYIFRAEDGGEYRISVGLTWARVMAPFYRALAGFALAGLVGMAGVLLFFFVTYRQRVRIRELAKLEQFRREFIADVSHEIKTPLTGILGAADMMDETNPLVTMIKKESKRLNGLVQSILDLARLERAEEALNLAETDLADLVRETVESLVPAAKAAGLELTLAAVASATVRVDAQLISQAISNLIVNAIRHSQSKDIVVSQEDRGKMMTVLVEDHGVGIPSEQAARIFERFHRVDPARAAETGGAGLGLAIVRRVARLHGGDATVSPAHPQGCCFAVTIAK